MKQKLLFSSSAFLCAVLLFTACKKSSDSTNDPTPDAQVATHVDDESLTSSEMDAVTSDANVVLESDASFSGNNAVVTQLVCDATVAVNKDTDPMTMTITYNGANCTTQHTRTGVVVVSMAKGTQWKNAGAVVTVSFQNLKITRKDNKSVTLNGTHTYTNVSGGLLTQLASLGSITHTVTSSNMSVSFDNGTARVWNVARQRVYTYESGIVLTITGTHSEGNISNIAEWGTNRFGKAFTTVIGTPLVFKQSCDFRLTAGAVTHTTVLYTGTVTFGLDSAGAPTDCPGSGHYYYKLVWTRANGNQSSLILPY